MWIHVHPRGVPSFLVTGHCSHEMVGGGCSSVRFCVIFLCDQKEAAQVSPVSVLCTAGVLLDRSDFEGMKQIKKRRPTIKELSWEDLRDPNTSGKAAADGENTGQLTELGTTLSSSFSHPTNTRPHVFPDKSQGETTALSVSKDESLCQVCPETFCCDVSAK